MKDKLDEQDDDDDKYNQGSRGDKNGPSFSVSLSLEVTPKNILKEPNRLQIFSAVPFMFKNVVFICGG